MCWWCWRGELTDGCVGGNDSCCIGRNSKVEYGKIECERFGIYIWFLCSAYFK